MATSHTMDFSGYMSDAELQISTAGFKTQLWTPEFGWDPISELEASEPPHPAQELAALQLFQKLFTATLCKCWVHLAAEMQAGKTGVIGALIRLTLSNASNLGINPKRIFLVTGMNDDAWKHQTRARLPFACREGVQHSKGLGKVAASLTRMAAGGFLSNVLIILDESHIASSSSNQPNKQIWQTLKSLCPIELWAERNIRVVTISATDPAKVMAVGSSELPCDVVRLQTAETYQSVEKLFTTGRIRFLDDCGDLHDDKGISALSRAVQQSENGMSLYHILRPRQAKQGIVRTKLETAFPGCEVINWDASSKGEKGAASDSSSSVTEELNDINQILSTPPQKTTFILLKNMFYAAKTMEDEYVGVLFDRISSASNADATALQSLLGRACGYGKSMRTIIFTQKQTVENYRRFWRELCSNPNASLVLNVPPSRIMKRMVGVTAVKKDGITKVRVMHSVATPFGSAAADDDSGGEESSRPRGKANEDDFTSEWKEFTTFELAKAWSKRLHVPEKSKELPAFFESSTTTKKGILRYDEIRVMMGGKKTANMPWGTMKVGNVRDRLYIGYRDIKNPASVVFVVRRLTKLR